MKSTLSEYHPRFLYIVEYTHLFVYYENILSLPTNHLPQVVSTLLNVFTLIG